MNYAGQHKKEYDSIMKAAAYFAPSESFIAGGALTSAFTGMGINDVDIYFKNKDAFMRAVEQAYDESLWCVSATDRAVTFVRDNNIVQLMHFDYFETAEAIFDAFDYTVCMAAYDIDKADFVMHEDFLKHAAQRFLRFHSGTRYPYGSLMRVLKYQQRGYTIGKSDLLRIGLCLQRVPLESWDDLAAAIGGQYGEKAKVDTDKPFSLEAALELFTDTEITTQEKQEMPGNAYDLLLEVGFNEEELSEVDKPIKHAWGNW